MSPLQKFVSELTDSARTGIIESFEQYERDGYIGDSPLREYAAKFMRVINVYDDSNITIWMNYLAFECYRYFYYQNRRCGNSS